MCFLFVVQLSAFGEELHVEAADDGTGHEAAALGTVGPCPVGHGDAVGGFVVEAVNRLYECIEVLGILCH